MHAHHPLRSRRLRPAAAIALAMVVVALGVGPAGAQYGGGANLIVDPVEVPIDGTFDYLGDGCPAGSTVEITVDGFPAILDTTIANDDSTYVGFTVDMPDGVVAGTVYRVEANCGGVTNFANITAVCNDGSLPIDNACPDGQTVGGEDPPPTSSTTSTIPGQGGSGNGGTSGGGDDGSPGGGDQPALAVTGASMVEQIATVGATLVAFGAILVLLTGRRRDDAPTVRPG
ncbi:MAG: hypothetical protein AAF548_12800 [Actinomycetota bacterium]